MTKVTLDVQPTFTMRQDVYENLPLAQLTDHFEDIVSSGYSVSLFTDWQDERINEVWVKRRVETGDAHRAQPEFYGAPTRHQESSTRSPSSRRRTAPSRWGCPAPGTSGCPHFRMGFTPSSGKELQSEYFVPRRTPSTPSSRSSDCATR